MSPFLPLWFHLFIFYLLSLQYTVLHILFFIFYSLPNMYSLVLVLHVIALSIERTWPDLHFTADYILYNSSQVKLSFIVIPLHVWTYSGTRCRASQDHGAT